MVGSSSGGFLQGNPVYDYDDHDYIGAYVQDDWRLARNVTVNAGVRWEPFIPLRNTYSWASNFDLARFTAGVKSTVYPQAPAGLLFPGDKGYEGRGTTNAKMAQFAPRLGAIWTPGGDGNTSIRAGWGVFYDTPHLFFNTRFANNPPWGAQITLSNPVGGWANPYLDLPGRQSVPGARTPAGPTQPFPAFGVYVNAPIDIKPTSLQQWNVSAQQSRRLDAVGDLPRQQVDPLVARHRAELRSLRTGRDDRQHQPAPAPDTAESGAGAVLRHRSDRWTTPARRIYHGMLLSAQRRLKNNLSVLTNYTLSKCMSDPATTEITGPTIVDPNNPDLDYSYLLVRSPSRVERVGGGAHRRSSAAARSTRSSATGSSHRWCGGRAATVRRSPPASTTR